MIYYLLIFLSLLEFDVFAFGHSLLCVETRSTIIMPGSYPSVQSFFRREVCLKDVQPMEGYANSSLVVGGGVEGNLRGGGNEKEDGVRIGGNGYGIARLEDGRGKIGDGSGNGFLRDTSGERDEVVEKGRDGDLGRGDGFTVSTLHLFLFLLL